MVSAILQMQKFFEKRSVKTALVYKGAVNSVKNVTKRNCAYYTKVRAENSQKHEKDNKD